MVLLRLLFRRTTRPFALACAVAILALFGVGLLLAGGFAVEDGASATITDTDLRLSLNDAEGIPDVGNGTQTCIASGTPRDTVSVLGDVTVRVEGEAGATRTLALSLAGTNVTHSAAIRETGTESVDVFWLDRDPETFAVGETVTLRLQVREGDRVLANATRTLPVHNGSQTFDCDEG